MKITINKRIKPFLLLSLIVIMVIGFVACQIYTQNVPETKSDILVSGCKKGECSEYIDKQDDLKVTFKCLGEIKGLFYWNNKTILLDDGNVLIYQQGSTFPGELFINDFRATLFNPKTERFILKKYIPEYLSSYPNQENLFPYTGVRTANDERDCMFDFIKFSDNQYLLNPLIIYNYNEDRLNEVNDENFYLYLTFIKKRKFRFNLETGKFINLANKRNLLVGEYYDVIGNGDFIPKKEQIKVYEKIIKTTLYPLRNKISQNSDYSLETMFVKTLNHKYNLFAGNCKGCDDIWKDCDAIWLEDPVALKRSKYGKLNDKVNYLDAEMLSNDKIYLISSKNIELFNPDTGEVKLITSYPELKNKPKTLLLKDKRIFILDPESKVYMIFDPVKSKIITTGKINSLFDDGNYADTYDITLLNDGKVLIYGLTTAIYDPDKNKVYNIKNQLTKRLGATLTVLKDDSILITGGFLDIELAKKLLNKDEGFVYNSAELITIDGLE